MDKVILSGARLAVRIGVTGEERAAPQDVVVDVELHLDTRAAARTDDLRLSVDYAAVREAIGRAAEAPCALVETLAERMAAAVLGQFPAEAVRVLVRKPGALREQGVDWAGVEITRRRGD